MLWTKQDSSVTFPAILHTKHLTDWLRKWLMDYSIMKMIISLQSRWSNACLKIQNVIQCLLLWPSSLNFCHWPSLNRVFMSFPALHIIMLPFPTNSTTRGGLRPFRHLWTLSENGTRTDNAKQNESRSKHSINRPKHAHRDCDLIDSDIYFLYRPRSVFLLSGGVVYRRRESGAHLPAQRKKCGRGSHIF